MTPAQAEVVRQRHLEELARKERKLELIKKKIDMERQRELRNRQEEKDRQIKVRESTSRSVH
mgnify:CR=1 FL=1